MVTSGAVGMPEELRESWISRLPHVSFFATYGLSEASPLVSILPADLARIKLRSVGRVLPTLKYKVRAEPERTSVMGELRLKGPSIMVGYFDNPGATHSAFDEHGWLCTGDIVEIDRDGDIIILGRRDDIINRAGEKIVPGEIERVISSMPGVREVAVIGLPDPFLNERVCAAVVRGDATISHADIYSYCERRLGSLKRPDQIVFMESLDKTHTGKIRKKAIAATLVDAAAKVSVSA